jgi:hypothetical protein
MESDAQQRVEYHGIQRMALWRCRCLCERFIDFADKLLAKASTFLVVPQSRTFKLALRSTPKNNAKRHRPKRARTSALISSQGTTSSGKESSSATRRSSSARCSSVSGKAVASAHMVAHISSTSASRSSTFSRSIPNVLTETPIDISIQNINLAHARARCSKGYNVPHHLPAEASEGCCGRSSACGSYTALV